MAQATPIDVSYTISGTPGDRTYDFTVKNNVSVNEPYLNMFAVKIASSDGFDNLPNWYGYWP